MDRYEKLWAAVSTTRAANAAIQAAKTEPGKPTPKEVRDEFSQTHGRAFFGALLEFFGDQEAYTPDVHYFMPEGKIDTRSLSALRAAPDQQVVVRLAADLISVDKAPLNTQLIPEFDDLSIKLQKSLVPIR